MKGIHLRFYTYENRKQHGVLTYQWLLDRARKLGIEGGSAFRALAGYGRHRTIHEQHFFELAGSSPVLVEFIATADQADLLFELLRAEEVSIFYARIETEFGFVGDDKPD